MYTTEEAVSHFLAKNPTVQYIDGQFIFDGTAHVCFDEGYYIEDGKLFYYFLQLGYVLNANVNLNTNNVSSSYEGEDYINYNSCRE